MNNEITTQNLENVKPCVKCGAQERDSRRACKACTRNRAHKYREANPEHQRKWQKANPERGVEYSRKYREANREKMLERSRKHYKSNREKELGRMRKWQKANSEKILENNRKWAKANPEKIKARDHNRRARIKGNGGKLSPNIVQTLLAFQKGKCACCGKSLKRGHHLDHIMPIALGGTNTDNNIQLLTPKCNLRKSAKHPDDWARENGRLI